MCSNGKCMNCISLETGSLIYAIISVILTGLGLLFIIGALVYVNVMIGVTVREEVGPEDMQVAFAAAFMSNVVLGVLLCVLVVPFAFTVVLIKGLVEKKAGLVKVYFIYSVVSKSLALIGALMGLLSGRYPIEHGITVLIATAFYGLILRLIYLTYMKLEADGLYKQTRLIEEKF